MGGALLKQGIHLFANSGAQTEIYALK